MRQHAEPAGKYGITRAGTRSAFMYVNAFIVYALCDARTHQIRYIGASEIGLARPTNPVGYKNNPELHGWMRDLLVCGTEYVVLVLTQASDVSELRALESFWIAQGKRSGWPLLNKAGFSLDIEDPERVLSEARERRWKVENWRRDPEVKARLAAAGKKRGSWKKK